jgi:hypothetical protein
MDTFRSIMKEHGIRIFHKIVVIHIHMKSMIQKKACLD